MGMLNGLSGANQVLLPGDCPNGWLAMLGAYLDDSGSHSTSDIVITAGVAGTEAELRSLEWLWRNELDAPLEGLKPRLSRFHMTECQDFRGEFERWSRTETDYLCHRLQTAIIVSGVMAYGMACSRKDWDDLVSGDIRSVWGDAEGMCITNCFTKLIAWAQQFTFDPEMSFIFDSRTKEVERRAKTVFDAYQRWIDMPRLVGVSFLSSHKILPLQAADMVAWEFYQYANDILVNGFVDAKRPQYRRLASNMLWHGQIATRESIKRIVDYAQKEDSKKMRAAAIHFTNFDPANPEATYPLLREQLS
jgi:hypothetical protein